MIRAANPIMYQHNKNRVILQHGMNYFTAKQIPHLDICKHNVHQTK